MTKHIFLGRGELYHYPQTVNFMLTILYSSFFVWITSKKARYTDDKKWIIQKYPRTLKYIYIVIHRQIYFDLSELISVARHTRFP